WSSAVCSSDLDHRLPSVLKAIVPASRYPVVGFAPAEFVNEAPAPLAPVRNDQILHIETAFAVLGMLLDVQEVGAVGRQDRRDIGSYRAEPVGVVIRPHGLESASRVVQIGRA